MATLNLYPASKSGGLKFNNVGPVRSGANYGAMIAAPRPAAGVLGASTIAGTQTLSGITQPANAPMPDFSGVANQAADAEIAGLNTVYDQTAEQLNLQLGSLGTQKANTLSSLDTQMKGVSAQVTHSKEDATTARDKNIQDALSTAQDVERSNRGKLRALGILNSSAGAELLSKPLNEFDKQRANITSAVQQRLSQLDDFLNQKTAEHAEFVKQVETQYTDLVGRIQSDLRFNERQRSDAIRAANAALQQRLAEIQQAQFNYAAQVDAMKRSTTSGISQIQSYTNPTFDPNAILAQGYNPNQTATGGQTASIYDDQRKKISDLYA